MRDAWAVWNAATQEWELGPIYDHSACDDCGAEGCIEEVDIPNHTLPGSSSRDAIAESITEPAEAGARPMGCATEGCKAPGAVYFKAGGVGSWFCADCYAKMDLGPFEIDGLAVDDLCDDCGERHSGACEE